MKSHLNFSFLGMEVDHGTGIDREGGDVCV